MSRHLHPRRPPRCRPTGARQAPAQRVFVTGVLASPEDFERARPWGLTAAPDHRRYLAGTATLLAHARRRFESVRVRRFHPDDFAEFCLLRRLDPADRAAQQRYLANPALLGQLLDYQGEELVEDFLPRLVRARENGLTMRHAELLLAEGGALPAVERCYREAAELFARLLGEAGPGTYEFRCVIRASEGPLVAEARVVLWEDGLVRIHDEELDLVRAVLCAALARRLPGRLELSGLRGSAAGCGEYQQAAWSWQSAGTGFTAVR
ncbi:hypothetical protein ACIGXM_28795 [Kitasatospora sp. NPDC052896]|uniref:hypothetical protein n=1 Tax=Kitasatospora sp. NPDC052896 TaxID=3364061 RepID=UPI0037C93556